MNKGATIVGTRSLDGRIMKGKTIELGTTTKLGRITMNVGTMELGTTTKLGRHLYTKDWRWVGGTHEKAEQTFMKIDDKMDGTKKQGTAKRGMIKMYYRMIKIEKFVSSETLENGPEIVLSHHENTPPGNSKNQDMVQSEKGQAETGIHEMKTYLQGVLAVISEFDNKLTSQLNTNQTLSDRS